MAEARIYEHKSETLEDLLRQASTSDGASLLIPDLQRPFVWTPSQVVLLIDSLIRGWPFGTLLVWSVSDKQVRVIPHRAFWTIVDRTGETNGATVQPKNPPGRFRMVLDGQQRVQSLILALAGDRSGFKLPDRKWFEALEQDKPRGRSTAHWSWGQLCLDLEAFARECERKNDVREVDYRDVLEWLVCNPQDGTSAGRRPPNYKAPLRQAADFPGRFIRLSRLWQLAELRSAPERVYRGRLETELLPEHGVPPERVSKLAPFLAELVVALGDVKAAPVSFLELRPFDAERFNADGYGNAVVNIFTRLNTAGRTLTTQEITFAWIKTNWDSSKTDGKNADECFEALRKALIDRNVALSIDELVQSVSVFWSVLLNNGELLTPKDLLRGEKVGPMASALDERWSPLAANIERCADLLGELELRYGWHFESLNSLIVLAAWRTLGIEWLGTHALKLMERDGFEKRLDDAYRRLAERWIVLTHWAGRWRSSSGKVFEGYVKDLARDWADLRALADPNAVTALLAKRLDTWLDALKADAESYIENLRVDRRDDVHQYFLALWVWHRLDASRWDSSQVQIPKGKKNLAIDVDHIVSCSFWEKHLQPQATEGQPEEDLGAKLNDLGNCFLLEKNFNISKSDKSLLEFLGELHEIGSGKLPLSEWQEALVIRPPQLDPASHSATEIKAEIEARTARIKEELRAFVRGEKAVLASISGLEITGVWKSSYLYRGKPIDAPMTLQQSGRFVSGTYGEKSKIEGILTGARMSGQWEEGDDVGGVLLRFADDGRRFEGTWGNGKKVAGGGAWTGECTEIRATGSPSGAQTAIKPAAQAS